MEELYGFRVLVSAVVLGLLLWLETVVPLFAERTHRLRRLGRHLALALLNGAVLVPVVIATALLLSSPFFNDFGLFFRLALPFWMEIPVAILLIDFWMYVWHWMAHRFSWLWRFHRMHHSDMELDATSAFRFHTGEVLLSGLFRLLLLPLLSIEIWHLILYELFMLPVVIFHHSNIRMPARADRILRTVVVTPWMHWVHHSDRQLETDSNYASIFSFWDRLFGTFRMVSDPLKIRFGLEDFRDQRYQDLKGLLLTPLVSTRPASRSTPEESKVRSKGTEVSVPARTTPEV